MVGIWAAELSQIFRRVGVPQVNQALACWGSKVLTAEIRVMTSDCVAGLFDRGLSVG